MSFQNALEWVIWSVLIGDAAPAGLIAGIIGLFAQNAVKIARKE